MQNEKLAEMIKINKQILDIKSLLSRPEIFEVRDTQRMLNKELDNLRISLKTLSLEYAELYKLT